MRKAMNKPLECGGFLIYHYPEVDSTNDMLMQEGRRGAKSGLTVVARKQTAGKGSKGRSFYSPPTGLYLSTLIRPGARVNANVRSSTYPLCPDLKPEETTLITPAVACAVADALQARAPRPIGIKWVNDIYFTGRKVCGILTESGVDECGDRFYVIGVGVNLSPPDDGFPEEFAKTATTLFPYEPDPLIRRQIIIDILGNINRRLYQIHGRRFLSDYRRRSVLIGKSVTVNPLDGSDAYQATALSIDNEARLVVKKSSGEEVTLRSEEVKVMV
ncbi:MAG: biotin--[acetyl-CoA-carboxylase] ligase [Oscillospiraceae bacterium]|nr:biotin--[acetyl-CoA-carboxylase] ligase [Oscillospiraceae bacterium]